MGNYVSTTSFSLMLPGFLKGNTTSSDTEGTNFMSRQVDLAEGKVNSVIASRYDIAGFVSTPPLLIKLTEDIAIYCILKKSGYRANDRNEYTDDFKYANETLDKLMRGELSLTYSNGQLVEPMSSARFISDTKDYPTIFNLDDETSWDITRERAQDIAATRD